MNTAPGLWRRLALWLARHASRVLPDAGPWADAMRNELDYIADDAAAVLWALGAILASYRARLARWRCPSGRALFGYVGTGTGLVLVIGFALMGHASGQAKPPQPVFDAAACDLPGVSPEVRARLRCGTVSVPRNYDNPDAGRFSLAVVVVKSARQPALPDPVVFISGGPGSPLTIYADQQARAQYAAGHAVVLVDQLGSGRSEP